MGKFWVPLTPLSMGRLYEASACTQCVPLATEPGISLISWPLMRILQRNLKWTTDTFLFISHTTNVLLFKFRCNIFIGVRIIKEMPGSVASGTQWIYIYIPPPPTPHPTHTHTNIYTCICKLSFEGNQFINPIFQPQRMQNVLTLWSRNSKKQMCTNAVPTSQ